jgi:hypothetical protein
MKKIGILMIIVTAAAFFFSSCNKEYAEPTIAWTPNDLSHYVDFDDETTFDVDLAVSFAAEAGIANIQITKYIYEGDVETVVSLTSPTGFDGLTSFDYAFSATNLAADFDGVTEIVYEFVVTDDSETPQSTKKEYTILNVIPETYTVTFNVVDEADAVITDATITFDGVTNAAGEYTFSAKAGTYEYTVAKDGYDNVTVTDYVMADNDATITVELLLSLSAWSADIPLALVTETDWAIYNEILIGTSENTTIGFAFTYTDGSTFRVTKTSNCDGWVLVDETDALAYTANSQITAAYTAGDKITEYDLPATIAKTYEARYFISKVGDEYLLVKYAYGYRNGADNTGNVVVFQYKN